MNKLPIAMGIAVIVIVAVLLIYEFYPKVYSSNNVILSLTDPANVPVGTQSLTVSYSSIMVHTNGSANSGWTSLGYSGNINLLGLNGSILTLGAFFAANGSKIDMIKLNVSSANIVINGTSYQVTLPSNQLVIHVNGANTVNGTTNVIIDLSPTIMMILTSNSTIFLMVPSASVVVIPHRASIPTSIGAISKLGETETHALEDASPNLSITSASLSNAGNITSLSLTVKDNSNVSVILRHVLLFGNQSVILPTVSTGGSLGSITTTKIEDNGNIVENHSDIGSSYSNENETRTDIVKIGENLVHFRVLNFQIVQNGSMLLPFLRCSPTAIGGEDNGIDASPAKSICPAFVNYSYLREGYNLTTGQSVTLVFNGEISLGRGTFITNVISGDLYKLVVQGTNGARATTNVTAQS
ncbi:MAG: DUF4382 domain-containing protein [Candidatus Parvarchaeota archaeon]|nr:DUF4382 domain-containing protein [Candidatus Parvarchaeota archaeon]